MRGILFLISSNAVNLNGIKTDYPHSLTRNYIPCVSESLPSQLETSYDLEITFRDRLSNDAVPPKWARIGIRDSPFCDIAPPTQSNSGKLSLR